jgi:hypothetical protein
MAAAFLLLGYPHGRRRHYETAINSRVGAATTLLKLPRDRWLVERCRAAGVDLQVLKDDPLNCAPRCLVKVLPGTERRGAATPWNTEEDAMFRYLRGPLDAFSLRIEEVAALPAAADVVAAKNYRGKPVPPVLKKLIFEPLTSAAAIAGDAALERLVAWGFPADAVVYCMFVVEPVLQLVTKGMWRTLMFRARDMRGKLSERWRQELAFPSLEWVQRAGHQTDGGSRRSAPADGANVETLPPDFWAVATARLRKWGPRILAGASEEEDRAETALELAQTTRGLDRLRQDFIEEAPADGPKRAPRTMHAPAALLDSLLFGTLLRDRGKMRAAAKQACASAMPASLRAMVDRRFQSAAAADANRIIGSKAMGRGR